MFSLCAALRGTAGGTLKRHNAAESNADEAGDSLAQSAVFQEQYRLQACQETLLQRRGAPHKINPAQKSVLYPS
jgi:hypothetical protein